MNLLRYLQDQARKDSTCSLEFCQGSSSTLRLQRNIDSADVSDGTDSSSKTGSKLCLHVTLATRFVFGEHSCHQPNLLLSRQATHSATSSVIIQSFEPVRMRLFSHQTGCFGDNSCRM